MIFRGAKGFCGVGIDCGLLVFCYLFNGWEVCGEKDGLRYRRENFYVFWFVGWMCGLDCFVAAGCLVRSIRGI